MHALKISPFELLTHLAAASQGGKLILSQADLLTTYCCKGLKCGSFSSVPLAQIEHLFELHILLTFLFSSFVRRCLAPTCRLPGATCFSLCLGLLCSCGRSLGKAAPGVHCPGLLPQGLFLLAPYCNHRFSSPGHRQRSPAQTKPAGGGGEGRSPSRQGASTDTHTSPAGPAGLQGQAGAWKPWQLSTPSQGNIWQSQRAQHLVFHNQTSILPFSSTGSSVVSCKSVRVELKCSFHLHLVECLWIVKISVLCVLGPLVPTERGTVLLAPHHTMQISTIYISRGFFTVSYSSNLIHCFLCCLGNRDSIPRILYQGLGITVPKCTKL